MPIFVNGLVIPDGFRAVAFKRSNEDRWYIEEEILQIRYKEPNAGYIFSNVLNGTPSLSGAGVYDDDYPTEEGYFWVRERTATINGITFVSNSLKDRFGIVSIRLSSKYAFNASYSGPRAVAFANEDYIVVIMLHDADNNDFINALSNPYIAPTYFIGHTPTPLIVPVYTITANSTALAFTTQLYIPDWRGETINLNDHIFLETRDYYHYYIDFADYMKELKNRMEQHLRIPVVPKSQYFNNEFTDKSKRGLKSNELAFIVYTIDYQDKHEIPLYRHRGPWETHHWVSARVNFEFHSSDFLIYRGFVIDFNWFVKVTNTIPSVRVFGPGTNASNAEGYYASIKWSVAESDWNLQEDIDEVNSSKGYYNYQYDFAAEIYYFWIRPKMANVQVEQILSVFTEPAPMDCESIRNVVTRINWLTSGNNQVPEPTQLTPYNHFYL